MLIYVWSTHPVSAAENTQSRAYTVLFGKIKLPWELQEDSHTNQALDVAGLVSDTALCQHSLEGEYSLY